MKLRQFFILTLLISIVSLSACVYRQDISQGNRINDEKLVQLEEGMTKAQVEFLLGTPAIIDIHHPDDWYYIHYLKVGNSSEINKRVMTLRFSEDLLMTIKGRDTF
ncbi:MAG: outer membrane protein assembly factor BamE [Candidatus Azotimanducaceae bacterium]|jgi:outer membrane protein assembly factor BamE